MRALLAVLAMLMTLIAAPATAQKNCATVNPKQPVPAGDVYQVWTPGGPVGQFRDAYNTVNCQASVPWKWGLVDGKGKTLVPANYFNVIPLNATTAAVLTKFQFKSDGNTLNYHLYVFGKGEQKDVVPWSRVFAFRWQGVRTPYAFSQGTGDVALLQGGLANPVTIRNLGGKGWPGGVDTFYQVNDTLIANFTADDGTPVSRILNLRGAPISPVIGGIERWETLAPEIAGKLGRWRNYGQYDYPTISVDYVSIIASGEHAALPYGKLYQPIAPNGDPLPMPPNAIGVFPIRFDTHPWAGSTTLGWAIVEESPQGLRARLGLGTLASVIARTASLPAYTGLARFNDRSKTADDQVWWDIFAARVAGDAVWRMIDARTLTKLTIDGAGSFGSNPRDALANFNADRAAIMAKRTAERERERLALAAKVSRELEDRHQWLLSSGKICEWAPGGEMRGPKTINYMLTNCPISNDAFFTYARSIGGDPGLIDKAEYAYYEKRGKYAVPIPPAPNDIYATPNWNAWGNAIINSARTSTDNFIRDSKRQYYSNMEKWNRGKQNWCC